MYDSRSRTEPPRPFAGQNLVRADSLGLPGASETLQNTWKVEWKLQKVAKVQRNLALYLYPVLHKALAHTPL